MVKDDQTCQNQAKRLIKVVKKQKGMSADKMEMTSITLEEDAKRKAHALYV